MAYFSKNKSFASKYCPIIERIGMIHGDRLSDYLVCRVESPTAKESFLIFFEVIYG